MEVVDFVWRQPPCLITTTEIQFILTILPLKTLISAFFCFFAIFVASVASFGQNTHFKFTWSTPADECPTDAIELSDGGYIVAAKTGDYSTYTYQTLLIRMNANGDTLKTRTFTNPDGDCFLYDLVKSDDTTFFGIGRFRRSATEVDLWILKMNENLDTLWTKHFITGFQYLYLFNGFIDSHQNLLVYGDGGGYYYENIYMYKFSLDGDSINARYYPTIMIPVHSMIEKINNTGYIMAIFGTYNNTNDSWGQLLSFDYDFNMTRIDSIPRQLTLYYNLKESQNSIYLTGKKNYINSYPRTDKLGILKLDTSLNVQSEFYLGPEDTISYPAYLHCLDFIDTSRIYYGGTVNYGLGEFAPNPSWYILGKFNADLTLGWQKYYGGDKYYNLWALTASADGGCLLMGSSYDYSAPDIERDMVIIKVDSNGVYAGIEPTQTKLFDAIVYPNPGSGYLVIESGPQISGAQFRLTSMEGKLVKSETLTCLKTTVNTQFLEAGTYVWQIFYNNRVIENGKWIKK